MGHNVNSDVRTLHGVDLNKYVYLGYCTFSYTYKDGSPDTEYHGFCFVSRTDNKDRKVVVVGKSSSDGKWRNHEYYQITLCTWESGATSLWDLRPNYVSEDFHEMLGEIGYTYSASKKAYSEMTPEQRARRPRKTQTQTQTQTETSSQSRLGPEPNFDDIVGKSILRRNR